MAESGSMEGVPDPIFPDDFESGECSAWSASTNPPGAPDGDEDGYGDENGPITFCVLPDGHVANITDCNDNNPNIFPGAAEICNTFDDDCDGDVDEDFDLTSDEENCGKCGNVCQPINCSQTCSSSQCVPVCNSGFFDCDGDPDNGCEAGRNTNPSCPGTTLQTIDGDQGSDVRTVNGFAEAWYQITIFEGSDLATPLTARVTLDVPPGVNFDLYAYCFSCAGTLAASSTGGAGVAELLQLRADDDFGEEDTHIVLLEIRFVSGSGGSCAIWTLTIEGNTGAPAQTCNP